MRRAVSGSELDGLAVGLRGVHAPLLRRVGDDDLPKLHYLLEVAQVIPHLLARLLAEQRRDLRSELAERRIVLELDPHFGAAIARRLLEAHRSGVVDLGP